MHGIEVSNIGIQYQSDRRRTSVSLSFVLLSDLRTFSVPSGRCRCGSGPDLSDLCPCCHPQDGVEVDRTPLSASFFSASDLYRPGRLDQLLLGLASSPASQGDSVTEQVTRGTTQSSNRSHELRLGHLDFSHLDTGSYVDNGICFILNYECTFSNKI